MINSLRILRGETESNMEAYLDNAATTRAADSVVDIMERLLKEDYGNPSSKHNKGFDESKGDDVQTK